MPREKMLRELRIPRILRYFLLLTVFIAPLSVLTSLTIKPAKSTPIPLHTSTMTMTESSPFSSPAIDLSQIKIGVAANNSGNTLEIESFIIRSMSSDSTTLM